MSTTHPGFVVERRGRHRIDRARKTSSLIPNEILLAAMRGFLDAHYAGRGGRLLDLGAGLAPYGVLYRRYFDDVVTVDHPESQHAIAVDVLAEADALPLADASFDCVLCTEVLEHCPDPDAVLREIHRVLRPGGRVFLTTPFLVALHEMPHDYYRYTPSALELMATSAGFTVESVRTKGDFFAVALAFCQFPVTKAMQTVARRLYSPRNPLVWLTVVAPQLAYLAYWRRAMRGGILGRIYRKLDYITLGYVTVLRRD